jgi:hypothetical protein
MTEVKVTLIHASPEALVHAQVTYLASVAEDEAVARLPRCLSSMRIQGMSVRAHDSDVGVVELLFLLAFLEVFALLSERSYAIMLLLMKVIRYLAIFAVYSCFCAFLKMLLKVIV